MPSKSSAVSQPPVKQPVDELQLQQLVVEWVPRATLRTNAYNPNRMTTQERALLRQSILEDGWTQPIVTLLDGTIVDGEQRWTTAGSPIGTPDIDAIIGKMRERETEGYLISESILERLNKARQRIEQLEQAGQRPVLADITGQLVPITRVDFKDDAHKMIATIRHNRARGTHQLDAMASITQDLQQLGLDFEDLQTRLGMIPDEIERLLEIAPLTDILEDTALSPSWEPMAMGGLTSEQLLDDDKAELARARSAAASAAAKEHAMALQRHSQAQKEAVQERVRAVEQAKGVGLTQAEKTALTSEIVKQSPPPPPPPKPAPLQKFTFYVTLEEAAICAAALGEPPVQGFLRLCREAYARTDTITVAL